MEIDLSKLKYKKDLVIIFIIIILPFVFYLYNYAPKTRIWETNLFVIDSGFIDDVNYYMWMIFVKIMTIIILSIWYLTCSYRWRFVIFSPIVSEIYKLANVIKGANIGLDSNSISILEAFIYSSPYILILLFISKKLNYYKQYDSYIKPLNKEINDQIKKSEKFHNAQYKSVKLELKKLEIQKSNLVKKEYLTELITLRDQLTMSN